MSPLSLMTELKNLHSKRVTAYEKTFKIHGISPKALQWPSKKSMDKRHRELVADIDFTGKTVLDVGCGFGNIITHISAKTHSFEYTGVDIVPEFIDIATEANNNRSKNEQKITIKFLVRDIFTDPFKKKFDVVISSGILNSQIKVKNKINVAETLAYRKKLVQVMWNHTKEVLAFNMAGGYPQPENKDVKKVYYADSLEILKFCFTLTNKIIFRHHYHKKDFTLVLFKK